MSRTLFLKRFALLFVIAAIIGCAFSAKIASAEPASSLVVKMAAGLTAEEKTEVIARNGGAVVSSIPALRLYVIEVPADDLPGILLNYQNDPKVISAEENKTRKAEGIPWDAYYTTDQWALPKIGWDSLFGTLTPSGTATVAVLDTGVNAFHPDLAGNVIPGTSILDNSDGQTDSNGHGTWMSGMIAANTNNAIGIAGVAFSGVKIMPVTVLSADGTGQDSDIIKGIIWAADHGADVILMGFSNPGFSPNLQEAIDYAWSMDVVLVAATGNDAISDPTYPAGDRGVIGVSSTDSNDALSLFSNYGTDISNDVFLAAPGENILTTGLNYLTYPSITGTSASAAIVAGVAAFMRANDPLLTNGIIVGRLARTADPAGTQEQTGNGRVNMARALADTSTDPIEPAGAPGGGPYVGPYVIAARNLNLTFAGTGSGSVTITPSSGTIKAPVTCGGTGTETSSQTVTGTCSPNVTTSVNGATVTFSAIASGGSTFAGWSLPANLSSSSCSSTTTPCSAVLGGNPALTVTFNSRANTTTTGSNATATFGDASVTLNATVSSTSTVNEGTVTFNVKKGATLIGTVTSGTVSSGAANAGFPLAGVNADTYTLETVYNPPTTNPKFNTSSDNTKTLTINKATPTFSNLTTSQTITYGTATVSLSGKLTAPTVIPVGGTINISAGSASTTATVATDGTFSATLATSGLNASTTTYTITYSYTATANFNAANDTSTTLTVNKADATINVSGYTGTYDAAAHGASGTATGVGGVDLTAGLNLGATFTDVPGGTALWTFTGGTNYNDASGDVAITINKADATIAVSGYTGVYNGNPHGATGSATGVKGETLTGLDLGASFTNVPGGTANWTFTDVTGNYYNKSGTATIVINKKAASVTPNVASKIIGAVDPVFTGSLTGFLPADGVTATYSRTPGETVGTYIISATLSPVSVLGNYAITDNTANFNIYYNWTGFLQPINDTAHQIGLTESKFRLGQTIPAKFVLKNAAGVVMQQTGNPTFTRSGNLGPCDANASTDIVGLATADTTPLYMWDGNQYHYNWSTKGLTAGEYRIYANLADGTHQWVDICLTK